MKILPTDESMSVLQVSEKVLELYSNKYLMMVKDAQVVALNAK